MGRSHVIEGDGANWFWYVDIAANGRFDVTVEVVEDLSAFGIMATWVEADLPPVDDDETLTATNPLILKGAKTERSSGSANLMPTGTGLSASMSTGRTPIRAHPERTSTATKTNASKWPNWKPICAPAHKNSSSFGNKPTKPMPSRSRIWKRCLT